jgi:hypothetical protein
MLGDGGRKEKLTLKEWRREAFKLPISASISANVLA